MENPRVVGGPQRHESLLLLLCSEPREEICSPARRDLPFAGLQARVSWVPSAAEPWREFVCKRFGCRGGGKHQGCSLVPGIVALRWQLVVEVWEEVCVDNSKY